MITVIFDKMQIDIKTFGNVAQIVKAGVCLLRHTREGHRHK